MPAPDLTSDLHAAEGLEPITLRRRDGSTGDVCRALRRAIGSAAADGRSTREAAPSDGRYLASDVKWHIAADALAAQPEPGDVIIDAGRVEWTVLGVAPAVLGGRWSCWARNLVIAERLDTPITIERGAVAKGQSGAAEIAWSPWLTGVPARIQPVAADVAVQHGQRHTPVTHHAFLAGRVLVGERHRIVQGDRVYHVVGYRSPDRLDQLMVVEVVESPWPLG